jgi:tellurite resistance protein TehA-like permease
VRKLRFAVFLPALQVVLALVLLQWDVAPDFYWSEPMLICDGLNAPAFLFMAPTRWPPIAELAGGRVLGTDISDIFFLAGVLVVWYMVGRALDRRRGSQPHKKPPASIFITHLGMLAVGGVLLYVALQDFSANVGYHQEQGILTLAWSISLMFISARGLLSAIRSRSGKAAAGEIVA